MIESNTDVIVIGGGIVGCSVGWEIASRGGKVTIVEAASDIFQGVTRAGFGSLTPLSDPFFKGDARAHAVRSVDLYRDKWIISLQQQTGRKITFNNLGLLELCLTDEEFVKAQEHVRELLSENYKAKSLVVAEARYLEPNLSDDFVGAIWLDEPWLDTNEYLSALRQALMSNNNIKILLNTRVAKITSTPNHVQVLTEMGDSLEGLFLVNCTGLRPVSIGESLNIPIKWIRGDALGLYTPDGLPLLQRHIYMGPGFVTPRANGRMLLGATYEEENGIPTGYAYENLETVEAQQALKLLQNNIRMIPKLSQCYIKEQWHNWRPTAQDEVPVLGIFDQHPRIIIATGFIGLGITMAPATAECVGKYCMDNQNIFPPSFDPNQFHQMKSLDTQMR